MQVFQETLQPAPQRTHAYHFVNPLLPLEEHTISHRYSYPYTKQPMSLTETSYVGLVQESDLLESSA